MVIVDFIEFYYFKDLFESVLVNVVFKYSFLNGRDQHPNLEFEDQRRVSYLGLEFDSQSVKALLMDVN